MVAPGGDAWLLLGGVGMYGCSGGVHGCSGGGMCGCSGGGMRDCSWGGVHGKWGMRGEGGHGKGGHAW